MCKKSIVIHDAMCYNIITVKEKNTTNKILYKIIKFHDCTLKIVRQNKEMELKKQIQTLKALMKKMGFFHQPCKLEIFAT
ncbi:hypothetical protein DWX11_09570 [Ruminococcus sp. AF18-29]|nr:hypothetical protein DWX11_09570 [Ruminococcus sp. AF18-29]